MNDPILLASMAALLLVIGAFAGVLAGLLGVGGGIVLVPAFFYAFGVLGFDGPSLMQICLGTSLATIVVTSLRSVDSHNRKGVVDWEILRSWAPAIALGAVIGVLTVAGLGSRLLQAIFGGLAGLIGLYMLVGRSDWRLAETMPSEPVRSAIAFPMGFLSVLMGIGGGSFGVPLMTLFGIPIHRAVATAAGFGVVIAVPSTLGFFLVEATDNVPPLTIGSVNLIAFGLIVVMTLLTAPLGASLAHRLDPKPLKRIFGAFLLIVALNMLGEAVLA
ncbi:sulfite exporter TauE/SafE family protein [Aestuariibius insulae]|uniref:sulfite exporter TauE/SafE family protein n=1 Tax=Aestuariibius insulae TaxID=2058287 RepID=UPI00345E114C